MITAKTITIDYEDLAIRTLIFSRDCDNGTATAKSQAAGRLR